MKKARYAFAALGAAPALGLLAPAATAAPASTRAQAGPAKTVRLSQDTTPAVSASTSSPSPAPSPQNTCHSSSHRSTATSIRGNFHFKVAHYGHCVDSVQGKLDRKEPGLSLRIRGYSRDGQLAFWERISGSSSLPPQGTFFPPWRRTSRSGFWKLNWNPVYEICGALVLNGTNSVVYGPVCLHP